MDEVGGANGTYWRGKKCIDKFEHEVKNHSSSRRRWENKMNMVIKQIGRGSVDWIQLTQDRILWRAFQNGNEHSGSWPADWSLNSNCRSIPRKYFSIKLLFVWC
jgi:hypothetical protein